jgi:hypothetical protein
MDKGNILGKYMPVRMIKECLYRSPTPSEIRNNHIRGWPLSKGTIK